MTVSYELNDIVVFPWLCSYVCKTTKQVAEFGRLKVVPIQKKKIRLMNAAIRTKVQKSVVIRLATCGFDPQTFGLWAQRNPSLLNRCLLTEE